MLDQSFSRRHGYQPLPEAMRLGHLSDEFRIQTWNLVRSALMAIESYGAGGRFFPDSAARSLERVLGRLSARPEDEVNTDYAHTMAFVKKVILQDHFNLVLDLLEFFSNEGPSWRPFAEEVRDLFESAAAPYRFDTSDRPFHFTPRGSKEQGEAIKQAADTLRQAKMDGASAHLRKAAAAMNGGRYAESVGNSIHAVESVARLIDPKAAKTLGPALKSLKDRGVLNHEALKKAFSALYGYSSNEQGIRHALLDKTEADVGLDEAMFMYGACASFAAYLVSKHRQINQ